VSGAATRRDITSSLREMMLFGVWEKINSLLGATTLWGGSLNTLY